MKTTPIPVKFDRQGHSCNFYAGFGPTPSHHSSGCKRLSSPSRVIHVPLQFRGVAQEFRSARNKLEASARYLALFMITAFISYCSHLSLTPLQFGNRKQSAGCLCQSTRKAKRQCVPSSISIPCKLTWLVLGGDPAARSHRVEQFTAL